MSSFIYILTSSIRKKWSYVGSSDNVERRFQEHRYGKVRSTKGMRPLILAHIEGYDSQDEARKREKYLKSGIGREEKSRILNRSEIV